MDIDLNCEIGDVFASALRTSGDTAKRKPPLDSANRIRLFTPRTGDSIAENGFCGQEN